MENFEPIHDSSGREERHQPTSPEIFSQNSRLNQINLLIYVIPVIGVLPSLWTLYRRQGSREQLIVSRQSVTMTFAWLLAYLLLATGSASSEFFALRLLILNSFLTSGYFLVSIWLIFRIIRGQSSRLPGLSYLAERVLGKYLS
ncbi:hypothetical protein H6G74_22125 [Nostoc spongiaeforme FACHB-130]|uniref:DUF4870 domain-containing protein n=1 Tax=Nostoc spongiaeforme FACHB-130 TaxID=1357510 RepID=A0ABR8G1A8_9NOSO|nr:hypothetical protein [Nostoc spongiaeforme]MBD2597003.1 hypothetical protein [Nostoc spongiaeforme FACHB-130]